MHELFTFFHTKNYFLSYLRDHVFILSDGRISIYGFSKGRDSENIDVIFPNSKFWFKHFVDP